MQQEKELNRKIYEFEITAEAQSERLQIQLDGTGGDQSMSERRDDSDGESEHIKKAGNLMRKGEMPMIPHLTEHYRRKDTGGTNMAIKPAR